MKSLETFNRIQGPVKEFSDLIGRCITEIKYTDDEIYLYLTDDVYVHLYHQQDCCESVYIEDICGDLDDLVGAPLIEAEEVSNNSLDSSEKKGPLESYDESYTWTFYKFATHKGSVVIRWYGTSNGYYSEYVDVKFVNNSNPNSET